MKKLLLIAILMLTLVVTVVACNDDKPPVETPAESSTVADPATEAPTAEPDNKTAAPASQTEAPTDEPKESATAKPEDPTEKPEEPTTAKPEDPTEPPTEAPTEPNPADPVWIIEPDAISSAATGGHEVASAEVKTEGNYTFAQLTVDRSGIGDPWFMVGTGLGTLPNYLAISYRTTSAEDGQIFVGSGAGPSGSGDNPLVTWNEDGNWNFLVVDLAMAEGLTSITDGNINYLRLDFFRGMGAEDDCFDIEYIAFFNTAEYAEAYAFAKHPPYIEVDDAAAGKLNYSFDTFYVNGSMYFPEDGGAGDKLTAINNTVTFGMEDLHNSMMLRGWIGFSQPIAKFGYYVDSYKMIYGEFATQTGDDVKQAGGDNASRFEILVSLADLEAGVHTVGFVAQLEDGTVVRLREGIKVVIVPYHKDKTIVLGVRDGNPFTGGNEKKFGQRYQIGENILKKITIVDLATYSDGNTNTWSFKVWQWNTDYDTTVAGTPLFATSGENHPDNVTFNMDIPAELLISGDIYYEIEYLTGSGTFTGWTAKDVVSGLETYVNGQLKDTSYAASITVGIKAERPENPDEETIVDVSGENATQVVFGEIYEDSDKGTLFDGNLHIEKNLGPAYFDGVRTNDWMEFKVKVTAAGSYDVCMVFGWLDHTGVYTIFVDGEEAGKIENQIPGTDWRTWTNSTSARISLTEGEHTVRVIMGSDGPNVYAINFTPVAAASEA